MEYASLAVGVVLLLFGRSLFWLLVGLSGFALGVNLTPLLVPDLAPALQLVSSIAIGILAALLAVLVQRISLGLAGFFIGALLAANTTMMLGHEELVPMIAVAGGVTGIILAVVLTDWAIIPEFDIRPQDESTPLTLVL